MGLVNFQITIKIMRWMIGIQQDILSAGGDRMETPATGVEQEENTMTYRRVESEWNECDQKA